MTIDTTTPVLRVATAADLPAVERLLADVELPTAGITPLFETNADDFVVADDPRRAGELAAVAGMEVCRNDALLRSVAVRPEWRAAGLGHQLVWRVVSDAERRGLRALYLLTMTAERYFPRFGFARVDRATVPADILSTVEFRSTCPASATVMARPIAPEA